jgi:hypothetical protein
MVEVDHPLPEEQRDATKQINIIPIGEQLCQTFNSARTFAKSKS